MNNELKPCPFCGDKKPMLLDNHPGNYSSVECRTCYVETADYPTIEEAIVNWNSRSGD